MRAAVRSARCARPGMPWKRSLGIDPALSKPAHQLEDAFYEVEDFAETVRQYRERAEFSPERLDAVQERLAAIRAAERKYGDTIDAVLAYLAASEQELAAMENYEEEKHRLEGEIGRTERELVGAGRELSQKRRSAAQVLGAGIEAELRLLGMPKASFRVAVQPAVRAAAAGAGAAAAAAPAPNGPGSAAIPSPGAAADGTAVANPWGLDAVEFVISPNLGEPFKRLRSIASGGELSRVMLAIKGMLAASDRMSTLIFDEVDAGIGGEVALSVGERLARLAASKQVLCVTHLATIAVRADNHLRIEKAASGGRTVTRVERVTGASRREEIARMLAGDRTGELSLQHAQELLDQLGAPASDAGKARTDGDEEAERGSAAQVRRLHQGLQGRHRGGAGEREGRQGRLRCGRGGDRPAEARPRRRQPQPGGPPPADELPLPVAARGQERGVPERGAQVLLQDHHLARGDRHAGRRRPLLRLRGVARAIEAFSDESRYDLLRKIGFSIDSIEEGSATTRSGSGRSSSWRAGSPPWRRTS